MTLVSERIGQFFWRDLRLEYTEYGAGERWVVLLPGRLLPRRSHERLARRIAGAGAHVVTVDLLGHGRSDRPADPMLYSLATFADQVVTLLDHLGADRAVLGGTSLGANVALEAAVGAPDRVQGLIAGMPVLDNGVEASVLASTPLLALARLAPYAVSATRLASRAVPRGVVPSWLGLGLDALDQRPDAMAALLHGLLFGRLAPPADERAAIEVPVLVVGQVGDPFHPVADAVMLAEEIAESTYVEARTALDRRLRPARLDEVAAGFATSCWDTEVSRRLADASS